MKGVEDRAVIPAVDGVEDELGVFDIHLAGQDLVTPVPERLDVLLDRGDIGPAELPGGQHPGHEERDDNAAEEPGQLRVPSGRQVIDLLIEGQGEEEENDGAGGLGELADEHLDEGFGLVPEPRGHGDVQDLPEGMVHGKSQTLVEAADEDPGE